MEGLNDLHDMANMVEENVIKQFSTGNAAEYRQQNMKECGYPYKFSVVMAVYNVEEYMREAVESLINQTIDFELNIQVILVNDGSLDHSGHICDEYRQRYPNNIVVVHKKNGGVSSARNAGLQYIAGRYVNFLDADDSMSVDTFERVYSFFQENEKLVDIVSIPIVMFGSVIKPHVLNYKYAKGARVIDLMTEYNAIQLSLSSSFIKLAAAKKISFDTELKTAEDAKEVARLLSRKRQIGVVSECQYNYRRRGGANISATQGSSNANNWYLSYMKHFCSWMYDFYMNETGYVPLFIQFTAMYDMQWKFNLPNIPEGVLTDEERHEFFELVSNFLTQTDDKIILEQKHMTDDCKYYVLFLKYGKHAEIRTSIKGTSLSFGNTYFKYLEDFTAVINFIHLEKDTIKIEGHISLLDHIDVNKFYLLINNETIVDIRPIRRVKDCSSLDTVIAHTLVFTARIPLNVSEKLNTINVCSQLTDGTIITMRNMRFGQFAPIGLEFTSAYWYKDGYKITANKSSICVEKCGFIDHVKSEIRFMRELAKSGQRGSKKAIIVRLAFYLLKPFMHKDIWLISDRINKADDNGEAFFRYMAEKNDKKIKCYFAIERNSPEIPRLRKCGKVIDFAWRYKFYTLNGAYKVSSYADPLCTNPFGATRHFYRDLLQNTKLIFLQHGVTKDNVADWLNKYKMNLSLFITTTNQEYASILDGDYDYDKSQVRLAGMPRYDLLLNAPKKLITIMPTWRNYLVQNYDVHRGTRMPVSEFPKSQFFTFYNSLLNHPELLSQAQQYGYTICFMPHPIMQCTIDLFEKNDAVKFFGLEKSYRDVFAESDMIITDYSSVAFDFAYLRKPLIYCQFDHDEFFSGKHTYGRGYFDYERDGFGEVETTIEGTVACIIDYMRSGCALKDKYSARINSTFAFNDKLNCERVYNAILSL